MELPVGQQVWKSGSTTTLSNRPEYLAYVYKRRWAREDDIERRGSSSRDGRGSAGINASPRPQQQAPPPLPERNIHLGLLTIWKPNPSGCARTEKFVTRKKFDTFAWLLSTHRPFPKLTEAGKAFMHPKSRKTIDLEKEFSNLKHTASVRLGVYRSKIHERGLFSLVTIKSGEMVIECVGEVIRMEVLEKRERYYLEKGIQCFSYRLDNDFALDATCQGNAARFINHSCNPNCYSELLEIGGKQRLIIISLTQIEPLDEITCNYYYSSDGEKITCTCGSKQCRRFLNTEEDL